MTDELLNDRMDGLAFQFKESQPAFYGEYLAARVIVDRPGGRPQKEVKKPDTTSTPEPAAVK